MMPDCRWAAIFVFIAVCIGAVPGSAQDAYSREYRIGAKDLLDLSVVGLEEMSKTVRVSEDGTISLPFLGIVNVYGLTKAELESRLAELLEASVLQDAQVTVFIREYMSQRVSVLGAVKNPGPYQLMGRQTLLQVIALAGGLMPDAGNKILIIREFPDGSSNLIEISRIDLMDRGDISLNIPLEPNDVISVPAERMVRIFVFGQVKQPGALIVKESEMPTLLQAIAMAGGWGDRASKGGVIIKWTDGNGIEQQQKINVKNIISNKTRDIPLKEGDIVIVPETIF